ncbi:hypothetical protein GS498_17845 [Rhodococcus hoagii]|nr:hypothetical protein [Prescottella equi]
MEALGEGGADTGGGSYTDTSSTDLQGFRQAAGDLRPEPFTSLDGFAVDTRERGLDAWGDLACFRDDGDVNNQLLIR